MTKLEAALLDLASFLDESRTPYMVVGGFANLHWGVERFTRDLDLVIDLGADAQEDQLQLIERRFKISTPNPLEFARLNHLIRVETSSGVPADLMISALPYERSAIRWAVRVNVGTK